MQIIQFKKALFLENDHMYTDTDMMHRLKRNLEKEGVNCDFIGQAITHKIEIYNRLEDCDAILFGSTFMYPADIKPIAKLLNKAKPKIVIIFNCSGSSLHKILTTVWTKEELMELDHHSIYEMKHCYVDSEEWIEQYDIKQFRREWDAKMTTCIPTGRKVKIGKLVAFGRQWSELKEGMIVDELNCSAIDPNPERKGSLWVMGLTEPVKLLSERGIREYEIVNDI